MHFVDGARGDDDLTTNGQISDPSGPATIQAPTTLNIINLSTPRLRFDSHRATWLLVGMVVMIAGVVVWRRRR